MLKGFFIRRKALSSGKGSQQRLKRENGAEKRIGPPSKDKRKGKKHNKTPKSFPKASKEPQSKGKREERGERLKKDNHRRDGRFEDNSGAKGKSVPQASPHFVYKTLRKSPKTKAHQEKGRLVVLSHPKE